MTIDQIPLTAHPFASKLEDHIRDVRAVQHFLMTHPDLPVSWIHGAHVYLEVPRPTDEDGVVDWNGVDLPKVADLVRMMKDGGTVDKHSSDDYMTYRRTLGKRGRIELVVPRKAACTARVVDTKVIHHEARAAYVETVDVIEWDCAPILAQAETEGTEVSG